MHQGSDYTSQYYPHHYPSSFPNPNPNPGPNPTDFSQSNPIQPPFASAPPYSNYPSSEFSNLSSSYPSYPQNPDPVPNLPPSAPSFTQPQFPHLQTFNPSPFPQEPTPPPYPHLQQPYYPYDSHQPAPNYANPIPSSNPNPNPSPYPSYESPYENPSRFDQGAGYFSDSSAGRYGFGQETGNDGLGDGVYAYDGGKEEPYGARGIGGFSRSSSSANSGSGLKFDDYGRSLESAASVNVQPKIVRAVPKMESQQDVKNGVQKFRVKLLPEGASVTTTDVLCQIGLDGIRMLDPNTNRTLRIYPLENVTRWEVLDKTIFAFWSKSPVDIEARRIRLQSNSYTTNTILDIVTAATVQLKEMGGKESLSRSKATTDAKPSDQTAEKKKGIADWINLIKPGNEEKDHWVPDEVASKCTSCKTDFSAFVRRHHCRNCGDIFCDKCTQGRIALTADEQAQPVRVCDRCMAEVSQRLSNTKEIASRSAGIHSHEDLARKLQEEMEKNRKSSSASKPSDGSGRRMREVACPICTVHLQVQVPASGSETIECGVCQHPFLVSAH